MKILKKNFKSNSHRNGCTGNHLVWFVCFMPTIFYNDKQIDVENFYIAELPLPPSQFEEDFKEIHQIVHGELFIIPSQASEYGFIVSSL